MKYQFSDRVVMVDGATNSCIYDLRSQYAKIYGLDKAASKFVRMLTTNDDIAVCEECKPLFSYLIENSLLTQTRNNSSIEKTLYSKQISREAWIEVTEKCQLKCSYCYGSFGAKKQNTLNLEHLETVVEQLRANEFSVFRIIGGEPLLYKDIVKALIKKLSSIEDSRIELFTNGLLVTEDFLVFCRASKVKLVIGIYGANETECFNVTGSRKVLEKQKKIIDLVRASGITYRLSITRSEMNSSASREDLANIYRFPVKLLREDKVKQVGRAENNIVFVDKKAKLIRKEYFSRKFPSSFILENMHSGHSCYKNKICITPSLDIHPCIMERSIVYGNLLQKPLDEILKLGEPYISASKDTIDICKDCEYRYACFDCRVNRLPGGGFFTKPSNCGYNPHTGIWVE